MSFESNSENPDGGAGDSSFSLAEILASLMGEDAAQAAISSLNRAGVNPDELAQKMGVPNNPVALSFYIRQLQEMINASGNSSVNWDFARKVAAAGIASAGDPTVSSVTGDRCRNALSAADIWLDVATSFGPTSGKKEVWNRQTWITRTMDAWQRMLDPIAEHTCKAIGALMEQSQQNLPAEMMGYFQKIAGENGIANKMIAAVYGQEMGQALAKLATEVCGSSDIGFPLGLAGNAALVPANIEKFAQGIEIPEDEVISLWALREAAISRLYEQVPWLRSKILQLVDDYARGVKIDLRQIEDNLQEIDMANPENLSTIMQGGLYESAISAEQVEVRSRLETVLALVEGWVEHVVTKAGMAYLPHLMGINEMVRRRRAGGGPAEVAFATLVGLEIRPRRIRDAATLWQIVEGARGLEGRDDLWSHPDLLPTSLDLDDPQGFLVRMELQKAEFANVDAEIEALISGELQAGPSETETDCKDDDNDSSSGTGNNSES